MNSERSSPDSAGTNRIFPLRRIGASSENSSKIVRIAYGGTNFPCSPPATTAPLLRSCTLDTLSSLLPVHAHDVHRAGRRADPEDARDAGVPRARIQFQLPERLVIEASEIAIVNPRRDRRFRDGDVEIVPGAVDHAIPALQLADEGGLIAGGDRDRC